MNPYAVLSGGFVIGGIGGTLYFILRGLQARFLTGALNTAYQEKHQEAEANDNFDPELL